jgi:hypothetical protein
MLVNANLVTSNNQPESRMREIRQSGSVGGETLTRLSYLNRFEYEKRRPLEVRRRPWWGVAE